LPKPGGFRQKVLQVAGGTALTQGLLVAASPLLTRLYSPEDFGVLAVYMSLVVFVVIGATLRYECALPLPEDEGEAIHVLALCLLLVAATTTLAALALFLLGERLLGWLRTPQLGPHLWLVPVSILGAGLYQVFNCWAIRKGGFRRMARTKVTQGVTQLAVQIGLGVCHAGVIGLLAGDALGRSNGTRTLAALDWRRDWRRLREAGWEGIRSAASRYRRFPFISTATALLNAFNLRAPALLLAMHYGPAAAGGFTLAQRVFALPSSVVGESVAQVYFGEFARRSRRDSRGLMDLFQGTVRKMFLLGLPLMVLACAGGWLGFPLVFGRAWGEAGLFVVALAPMALAQFAGSCADSSLLVLERQDLAILREAVRTGLLAGAVLTAYGLGWSPVGAVFLFGATGTLAYTLYGAITWHAIRNHGRKRGGTP
jgi:O-antigen/teichoic acid export membrane protein